MISCKVLALSLCFVSAAVAQEALTLLQLDHVWRYEGSGADLGTAWREIAYDESAWPQGRGVLAIEDNAFVTPLTNTVLTRVGTNGEYKVIDYFRTRFTLPELRPGYVLSATVLVDDGAVAYLNGTEVFRIRMPAGPVFANTLASETIDVGREGVFVFTNALSPTLHAGENVLAVEVHQLYLTSSDVTWGMILAYAPMEPVSIVMQPQDRVITEGATATFTTSVKGALPRFQWWRDDQPLPGQTNATLSRTAISRADAGQYFLTVSNDVSAVTSRVATLTVLLDREPPRLVSVNVNLSDFSFHLQFSEPLDQNSVTNRDNYRVVDSAGNVSPILYSLGAFGSSGLIVFTNRFAAGTNYYLFVSNVRDRFGNVIEPNTGYPIPAVLTNIPLASTWKYNDSGIAPAPEWNQLDYDDSQWPSGPALLYNDVNISLQSPGVLSTLIQVTNATGSFWTHYFRLDFTNNFAPLGSSFEFSHYLDDGAVFYLNGREVSRFNMSLGVISSQTRASSSAQEGRFNGSFTLSGTNFVQGHNVLAVEVHQFSLTSPDYPDISFGMQCRAQAELLNTPPVILQHPADMTVHEHGPSVFRGMAGVAESVQWLQDGVPIPGAAGMSYTNTYTRREDSGLAFAMVASNSLGMVTSRTARLTVIPDLAPPRLLSARMGTNVDHVTLAFSEPLDLFSLAPENFVIADGLGGILPVSAAELVNDTNIVLTTGPRVAGPGYVVAVSNIIDLNANFLEHAVLGIDYEDLLVRYQSVWRYDDSGTNYDNSWRDPAFNDDAWPSGPGLLGFEDSPPLPIPITTMLPPPEFRGPTYFFRTHFNFSGNPTGAVLRLRHLIDDGVVLFLNGQEVHRIRVPLGQNATTLTDSQANDGTVEGPFEIPVEALVTGDNVLAGELHQASMVSADAVFGIELVRAFPADPATPVGPVLNFQWQTGQLLLSWEAWEFVLESAPQLPGPWAPVPRPTIPFVVDPANASAFYRLKKNP